jgi:hypothetical protein
MSTLIGVLEILIINHAILLPQGKDQLGTDHVPLVLKLQLKAEH